MKLSKRIIKLPVTNKKKKIKKLSSPHFIALIHEELNHRKELQAKEDAKNEKNDESDNESDESDEGDQLHHQIKMSKPRPTAFKSPIAAATKAKIINNSAPKRVHFPDDGQHKVLKSEPILYENMDFHTAINSPAKIVDQAPKSSPSPTKRYESPSKSSNSLNPIQEYRKFQKLQEISSKRAPSPQKPKIVVGRSQSPSKTTEIQKNSNSEESYASSNSETEENPIHKEEEGPLNTSLDISQNPNEISADEQQIRELEGFLASLEDPKKLILDISSSATTNNNSSSSEEEKITKSQENSPQKYYSSSDSSVVSSPSPVKQAVQHLPEKQQISSNEHIILSKWQEFDGLSIADAKDKINRVFDEIRNLSFGPQISSNAKSKQNSLSISYPTSRLFSSAKKLISPTNLVQTSPKTKSFSEEMSENPKFDLHLQENEAEITNERNPEKNWTKKQEFQILNSNISENDEETEENFSFLSQIQQIRPFWRERLAFIKKECDFQHESLYNRKQISKIDAYLKSLNKEIIKEKNYIIRIIRKYKGMENVRLNQKNLKNYMHNNNNSERQRNLMFKKSDFLETLSNRYTRAVSRMFLRLLQIKTKINKFKSQSIFELNTEVNEIFMKSAIVSLKLNVKFCKNNYQMVSNFKLMKNFNLKREKFQEWREKAADLEKTRIADEFWSKKLTLKHFQNLKLGIIEDRIENLAFEISTNWDSSQKLIKAFFAWKSFHYKTVFLKGRLSVFASNTKKLEKESQKNLNYDLTEFEESENYAKYMKRMNLRKRLTQNQVKDYAGLKEDKRTFLESNFYFLNNFTSQNFHNGKTIDKFCLFSQENYDSELFFSPIYSKNLSNHNEIHYFDEAEGEISIENEEKEYSKLSSQISSTPPSALFRNQNNSPVNSMKIFNEKYFPAENTQASSLQESQRQENVPITLKRFNKLLKSQVSALLNPVRSAKLSETMNLIEKKWNQITNSNNFHEEEKENESEANLKENFENFVKKSNNSKSMKFFRQKTSNSLEDCATQSYFFKILRKSFHFWNEKTEKFQLFHKIDHYFELKTETKIFQLWKLKFDKKHSKSQEFIDKLQIRRKTSTFQTWKSKFLLSQSFNSVFCNQTKVAIEKKFFLNWKKQFLLSILQSKVSETRKLCEKKLFFQKWKSSTLSKFEGSAARDYLVRKKILEKWKKNLESASQIKVQESMADLLFRKLVLTGVVRRWRRFIELQKQLKSENSSMLTEKEKGNLEKLEPILNENYEEKENLNNENVVPSQKKAQKVQKFQKIEKKKDNGKQEYLLYSELAAQNFYAIKTFENAKLYFYIWKARTQKKIKKRDQKNENGEILKKLSQNETDTLRKFFTKWKQRFISSSAQRMMAENKYFKIWKRKFDISKDKKELFKFLDLTRSETEQD